MPLSQQAQTLADKFTDGLTPDQRTNFNNVLQNSPALVTQINAAVASGDLTGFVLLPPGVNASGKYRIATGEVELRESMLTTPDPPARFNPGPITFTIGHEVQHAINRPEQMAARAAFADEVNRIAQTPQTAHDYTQALDTRLELHRKDEAQAHIAGYNAVVGMHHNSGNQKPSLEDLYRSDPGAMQDFITVTAGNPPAYALRTGLTLNADMTMTPNTANVAAVGQHFYDKPAAVTRLGSSGDSDYQNHYAAPWVGYIAQVELINAPERAANGLPPAQLQLNMSALGLNEAQLERNGLTFGGAGVRQSYFDTSTNPPTQGNFDDTVGVNRSMPAPRSDAPSSPEQGHALTQPPNHPAVLHAMKLLDSSPNIPSDAFGPNRYNVAAGVALHAAGEGLRPDHIVLNKPQTDLIVVQGQSLDSPTSRLSMPLPVAQAIATDLPTANRQLETLQPAPTLAHGLTQPSREVAPQQESPVQEAFKPMR